MGSVAELKDGTAMMLALVLKTWQPMQLSWVQTRSMLLCAAAAVKDALQRKGLLPQLQANVRSQIFNVLLAAEVSLCTLNAANSTMYPQNLHSCVCLWHS
jgi:hypothetical protein